MEAPKHLRNVLVVDDDRFIRLAVQKSLSATSDIHVAVCESGAEAIEVAKRSTPDLVLLDVVMPDLDGPGTLKKLRAVDGLTETPVVFFTAGPDVELVNRLQSLGASGVIEKPFDPATLANRLIAFWSDATRAGNESPDALDPTSTPPSNGNAVPTAADSTRAQTNGTAIESNSADSSSAASLLEELQDLFAEYARELPGIVLEMIDEWAAFEGESISGRELGSLRDAAHRLHGSSATFDFAEIAELAGRLESVLSTYAGADEVMAQTDRRLVSELLSELEGQADTASDAAYDESRQSDLNLFISSSFVTAIENRLLVVDDMALVRKRYRLALEAAGFSVDTAQSGEQALELADQNHYNLILMDLSMPGMSGFEVQRALRMHAATSLVPIIFMTATKSGNLKEIENALALGVSGFVTKSLPLPQLVEKIQETMSATVPDK